MLLAEGSNPGQNLSIFDPASPATQSIFDLAMLVFAITGLIYVVVTGVLLYCVWKFRERPGDSKQEPPQVYGSQPIEVAWTAAPALIVFFLMLVTMRTLWEVKDHPTEPQANDNTLYVTVIGRQWWWEYQYEYYNGRKLSFTTANELHIPVSAAGIPRPVRLSLKSADVCHSYWVPRLAGKVDLIPGRTNSLTLQTSEPGLYYGQCAEYCGTQHAHMLIRVTVESPEEFEHWLENQAIPAVEDAQVQAGKEAFLAQSCVKCHAIRGTAAVGTFAPDLTHLMSRETLASCELKNTRENLARWVRDPQSIKPGCLMPAFGLIDRDEEAIVDYLMTLR